MHSQDTPSNTPGKAGINIVERLWRRLTSGKGGENRGHVIEGRDVDTAALLGAFVNSVNNADGDQVGTSAEVRGGVVERTVAVHGLASGAARDEEVALMLAAGEEDEDFEAHCDSRNLNLRLCCEEELEFESSTEV